MSLYGKPNQHYYTAHLNRGSTAPHVLSTHTRSASLESAKLSHVCIVCIPTFSCHFPIPLYVAAMYSTHRPIIAPVPPSIPSPPPHHKTPATLLPVETPHVKAFRHLSCLPTTEILTPFFPVRYLPPNSARSQPLSFKILGSDFFQQTTMSAAFHHAKLVVSGILLLFPQENNSQYII